MSRRGKRRRRRDAVARRSLPTSFTSPSRSFDLDVIINFPSWTPVELDGRNPIGGHRQVHPENVNRGKSQAKFNEPGLHTGVISAPVVPKSICDSRREREEVIHATGKAGRRGQRRPLWTKQSRVRCK